MCSESMIRSGELVTQQLHDPRQYIDAAVCTDHNKLGAERYGNGS